MKHFCLLLGLYLYTHQLVLAQNEMDSTNVNTEEDSIVYIDVTPVIIKKTIEEEEVIFNNWYLDASMGTFLHSNKHCVCTDFVEYKNAINKQIEPILGNTFNLNLMYRPKKSNLIFLVGFSTSHFKDRYTEDSSNLISKNKYNYADVRIGSGYWVNRKKKVSLLVSFSFITSRLLNQMGTTLDYKDPLKEYTLVEADRSADWVLSGKLGAKIIFLTNKQMKLFIEPYSQVNFTSVLKYKAHYYQRRWGNGLNLGTIFVF